MSWLDRIHSAIGHGEIIKFFGFPSVETCTYRAVSRAFLDGMTEHRWEMPDRWPDVWPPGVQQGVDVFLRAYPYTVSMNLFSLQRSEALVLPNAVRLVMPVKGPVECVCPKLKEVIVYTTVGKVPPRFFDMFQSIEVTSFTLYDDFMIQPTDSLEYAIMHALKLELFGLKNINYWPWINSNLQSLDVSFSTVVDANVLFVLDRCPHLTNFRAINCRLLGDESFRAVVPRFSLYALIDESGFVDRSITNATLELIQGVPELTLMNCQSVDDAGVMKLAPALTHVKIHDCLLVSHQCLPFRNLVLLDLDFLLTDDELPPIEQASPNLKHLAFDTLFLTDAGASHVGAFRQLETLYLRNSLTGNLTGRGLVDIALGCPLLGHVLIEGQSILDVDVADFIRLSRVATIILHNCSRLTPHVLSALAGVCHHISGCPLVFG
jgi:hypothetical protein